MVGPCALRWLRFAYELVIETTPTSIRNMPGKFAGSGLEPHLSNKYRISNYSIRFDGFTESYNMGRNGAIPNTPTGECYGNASSKAFAKINRLGGNPLGYAGVTGSAANSL